MASKLMRNYRAVLNERAADLAAAPTPQAVEAIVEQAETEAVRRTEVPNTFVYQVTVIVLGIAVIGVVVAQVWLTLEDKNIPEGVIAIGSAAIGALAGLLAPTPSS